jgi:hypothetical protein
MKTKLTLFVAVIVAALFGTGCSSFDSKNGLLAHWAFDSSMEDASGNDFHAAYVDGKEEEPSFGPDRNGVERGALSLNGKTNLAKVDHQDRLVPKGGVTFSVWYWNTDTRGNCFAGLISSSDPGNAIGLRFGTEGSRYFGVWAFEESGEFKHFETNTQLKNEKWTHVTLSFDGLNRWAIFENGVRKQEIIMPVKIKWVGFGARGWRIGAMHRSTLEGSIDDVRIYNRALSAEEVKALYELEKPKAE